MLPCQELYSRVRKQSFERGYGPRLLGALARFAKITSQANHSRNSSTIGPMKINS